MDLGNLRATFITLAIEDGADADIIESRVTHTKKSRRAFDGYVRGEQWVKTCTEVAKLNVHRLPPEAFTDGKVIPFATGFATADDSSSENVVEAAGVEPRGTTLLDEYLPDSSRQRPEWFPPIPRSLARSGSVSGSAKTMDARV